MIATAKPLSVAIANRPNRRGPPRPRVDREGIEANSTPEPNTGCWLWLGAVNDQGYGRLGRDGTKAHRASFVAFHRPLTKGEIVCHRCDNPSCVNPGHLFAGSPLDNMRDKVGKGRMRGHFRPGPDSRRYSERRRQ